MKRKIWLWLAIGLVACAEPLPTAPALPTGPTFAFEPAQSGRYIVLAHRDVPGLLARYGIRPSHEYRHAVQGFAASLTERQVAELQADPRVRYVEPDGIMTISGTQVNPPWGLDRIDQRALPLDQSYSYATDGAGVTAYILDTGISFTHTEFGGRAFSGYDFIDNDPDASDCHGHGTHVAGTIGGTTVGVAKNVSLIAVRVLDCAGSGSYSQVIAGVDWLTKDHTTRGTPAVANMSLGGGYSQALNDAVAGSVASGVTYAVAAGNARDDACTVSPASAPTALTVGATDATDARASFSNYGDCLDLFAPGVGITSSTMDGAYASWSGTSMATPHVAGVAALILSAYPGASPAQVDSMVHARATKGVVTDARSVQFHLVYSGVDDDLRTPVPPPLPPPPTAPSNLTVEVRTVGEPSTGWASVVLRWQDNSVNEDGFDVQGENTITGARLWGGAAANITELYTYLTEGPWWVEVRATGAGGTSLWVRITVCVPGPSTDCGVPPPPPPPPPPPLSAAFVTECTSFTCQFTAVNDGEWDFGDGTVGNGRVVTHTFTKGSYLVSHTVGASVVQYFVRCNPRRCR